MKSEYIFVYGTLRDDIKNSNHQLIAKYTQYIGFGFVKGKLYRISWYPGVILERSRKNKVYGKIYQIKKPFNKKLLKIVDNYEECSNKFPRPHEFTRAITTAYLNGIKLKVWIYTYNLETKGLEAIESGDFARLSSSKIKKNK